MSFRTHLYDLNLSSVCTCLIFLKHFFKRRFSRPPTQWFWSYNFLSSFFSSLLPLFLSFYSSSSPSLCSSVFSSLSPHPLSFSQFLSSMMNVTLSLELFFCCMVFSCLTRYENPCSIFVLCPWTESFRISVSDYEDFITVHISSM